MPTTLADFALAASPGTPALATGPTTWTYGDLVAEAHALADLLRSAGVGEESVVALDLPSGPRFVAAAVACGLLDAAFMPMDLRDPAARRERMTDVAKPSAVVTAEEVRALVGGARLDARLPRRLGSAAYVSFTSGSTGEPKAVVTEQPAAVNYLEQAAARFGLAPGDRQLQLSAATFDIAVDEIFSSLRAGATVVFRDDGFVYADVEEFLALCADRDITVLNLPTGLWNRFGAELAARPSLRLPPGLRLVVVGGEAAAPEAVRAWHDAATAEGFEVVNAYGPTEAAVSVTFADLDPGRPVVIGREIAGVVVRVLDENLASVPDGSVGELVISGTAPARGYLGHPHGGFLEVDGAWSYRTGDLARREPSGDLTFHGRVDDQVKVRGGYRVQPSGVERVLADHRAVRQCAVVPIARGHAKVLGALVVPDERASRDLADSLRHHAAERLPAWMVPSVVSFADELPLTGRGKVDTRAVTALLAEAPGPGRSAGDVAEDAESTDPTTDPVRVLEEAWTLVLGSPPESGEDNFFEEGGDSLAALELVEVLADRVGVNLQVAELYRNPTFDGLVELVLADEVEVPAAHHVSGRTLVKLRRSGTGRLWCFLPPLSGAVTRYASMARILPPREAVWAMETPAELSGSGMSALIKGLAEALLAEDLTPFDTVVLSGYSLGGVFAHELAAHVEDLLEPGGRPVRVQALLLDPPDPALPQMTLAEAFDIFVRVGWRIPDPVDGFVTVNGELDLVGVAEAARRTGSLPPSAADREVVDAWEVYASNTRILDCLELAAGAPDTSVLQCREGEAAPDAWWPTVATGSWGTVVADDRAFAIGLEHFQLMEPPNDSTVARWLVHESDALKSLRHLPSRPAG